MSTLELVDACEDQRQLARRPTRSDSTEPPIATICDTFATESLAALDHAATCLVEPRIDLVADVVDGVVERGRDRPGIAPEGVLGQRLPKDPAARLAEPAGKIVDRKRSSGIDTAVFRQGVSPQKRGRVV